MKICVVGAGAIGGYLAARLALAGNEVSVVARGRQLAALRSGLLKLVNREDGSVHGLPNVAATDTYSELGPQDLVFLAVKAHQIGAVAADMRALYGTDTAIISLQNGIPWWYFHRHGGALEGTRLKSLDCDGAIDANVDSERVLGCVAYKAAEVVEPGTIRHSETVGDRFLLWDLDGTASPRVAAVSRVLEGAGIRAPVVNDIRMEKWFKLLGNLVWNPICALTHADTMQLYGLPETRQVGLSMMAEAQTIAEKLGIRFSQSAQSRMAAMLDFGPARPSMLQDTEAGRPLEIDALLGAVVELARLTNTPVPHVETIHACAKLLATVITGRHLRVVTQSC